MIRALSTAATGMDAQQTRLDVTANNIANVSTAGFKRSRAEFQDLMYQQVRAAGDPRQLNAPPTALEVGMGVRTVTTSRQHSEGDLRQTGNPLDVAIEGRGYFVVQLPNGERAYTRDGTFKLNAEGRERLLAEYENEPLAAIVVAAVGGTACYLWGASSDHERSRMPNHALQWEGMRWARDRGATRYDFWGIPDDIGKLAAALHGGDGSGTPTDELPIDIEALPQGELWGVYRFKQGFGGSVVRTVGAWDMALDTVGYRVYQLGLGAREVLLEAGVLAGADDQAGAERVASDPERRGVAPGRARALVRRLLRHA